MNIGEAVSALKDGKLVRRAGWNGKGMHIFITGESDKVLPYISLFTAQKVVQPGWNASTPDLLADDWEVVPPGASGGRP